MLAKVYLARSGWKGGTRDNADLEKAKELAADVINNSGISLYENYEDLFKYKHNNNPESLIASFSNLLHKKASGSYVPDAFSS